MRFALLLAASIGALVACQSPNPDRVAADATFSPDGAAPPIDAAPDCRDEAPCDDGNPCTTGDVCSAGRCAGTPRDCADDDPCTADACELATGACTHDPVAGVPEGPPGEPSCSDGDDQDCDGDTDAEDLDCRACRIDADCPNDDPCRAVSCSGGRCAEAPVGDGQSCETNDPCREKGTCVSGRCEAAPRTCPDPAPEDPCLGAICQPGSGACVPGPTEEGTACDDGDACTTEDVCTAGTCGGLRRDCSALDEACVAGTCDPESGECRAIASPDGTPCGADHCVADGTCVAGRCEGRPLDCAALDGQCRVGACDAESGACTAVSVPDGTPCDDDDPCTFQDTCSGAGCAGVRLDCGVLDTACQIGRCDPEMGACVASARPDGAPCDDGASCTGPDRCASGICGGPAVVCEDVDARCAVVTCDEAAGGCVAAAIADGRACDDGDLCSVSDACTDGTCAGALRDCTPPSACFVGECEPSNGACIFSRVLRDAPEGLPGSAACADGLDDDCDGLTDADDPDCRACAADADCAAADPCARFTCVDGLCRTDRDALEGAACDDGNPCTTDDLCRSGLCLASPVDCGHFDSDCSVGRCDVAAGGCVVEYRPDGAGCDDRDPCTHSDICTAGLCAGAPRDCSGLDGECRIGTCDPRDGECRTEPRADGAPCTDGAPCSGPDVCSDGVCAGPAVACEAGPCEVGACDPASGACRVLPAEDGVACDDGDPCTESDTCAAGACGGRPRSCAALDGPCVVGVCAAESGECRAVPRPDATPCDDGSLCTADEACHDGRCVGTSPDCSALDGPCRTGVCDPETGACAPRAAPAAEGAACDDADACTTTDRCTEGRCVGEVVDCSRLGGICSRGRCDPDSGACVTDAINEGLGCDDGNPCTTDDVCTAGVCGGAGLDCSALNGPCTVGQCDDLGACVAVPRLDGTACETGDLCDDSGVCTAGVCRAPARDCSALDTDCARGTCDARNGACVTVPAPDAAPCDDGSICTEFDACLSGECQGRPKNCLYLDTPCTEGTCDPAVPGGCWARPVVDGIPCSSGNLCQVGEACTAGVCRGAPRDCPAPPVGSCRVAVCDPQTGACGFTESPNGTPCNDGDFCTVGETCQAGNCGAARPRDCNPPGEPCRLGTCDEANDRCVVQNRPDNTGCDDGAYCTVNDRCFDGVCRAIQLRDCPDANAGCRVGRCNEGADRCDIENAFDFKPCSDGTLCTLGDHCEGGACIPGARVCN